MNHPIENADDQAFFGDELMSKANECEMGLVTIQY